MQRLADQFFRYVRSVAVGRVNEIDADLGQPAQRGKPRPDDPAADPRYLRPVIRMAARTQGDLMVLSPIVNRPAALALIEFMTTIPWFLSLLHGGRLNSTSNASRTQRFVSRLSLKIAGHVHRAHCPGLLVVKRGQSRAHSLELRDLRQLYGHQAMLGEEELCDVLARFCDASDAPNQGHAFSIDALIRVRHKPGGLVGVDRRDLRLGVRAIFDGSVNVPMARTSIITSFRRGRGGQNTADSDATERNAAACLVKESAYWKSEPCQHRDIPARRRLAGCRLSQYEFRTGIISS